VPLTTSLDDVHQLVTLRLGRKTGPSMTAATRA